MLTVTDTRGETWTVRRRWWFDMTHLGGADVGSEGPAGLVLVAVLVVAWWPIWFLLHWFGLPWRIATYRDGVEVEEVTVRGWFRSERRIWEIAEGISSGAFVPH